MVSFPRNGVNSDRVVLKGAKECIEGAKKANLGDRGRARVNGHHRMCHSTEVPPQHHGL